MDTRKSFKDSHVWVVWGLYLRAPWINGALQLGGIRSTLALLTLGWIVGDIVGVLGVGVCEALLLSALRSTFPGWFRCSGLGWSVLDVV